MAAVKGSYIPSVSLLTMTSGRDIIILIKEIWNEEPANIIDNIFQLFTTKPTKEGKVGLSISYDIIKRHGGDIKVTSTDKEALFTVSLPV